MAVTLEKGQAEKPAQAGTEVPPLESGDRLTAQEFLRRYEAMPRVKKAELIEGIVYMGYISLSFQHRVEPQGPVPSIAVNGLFNDQVQPFYPGNIMFIV